MGKLDSGPLGGATFDDAVRLTGFGRFHYESILVCSLCVLIIGFQNGLSAYVFPAAQCELHLTSYEIGLLNVAFLAGGTVSCFFWGILADLYGRRKVLIGTHLANGSVTILCALSPYTTSIVLCRFLNGFLIGGPGSIIFPYFAEFQPPKFRNKTSCYCGLFFTLSWLILPLLAHLILPLSISYNLGGVFVVSPWRLFMVVIGIPEILVGLWFVRMPESPKYYAAVGKVDKSLGILKKMYAANTGRNKDDFPVKYLKSESKIQTTNYENNISCERKVIRILKTVLSQIKSLYQPPLRFTTVLMCSIMFTNMFGMFGLGMWLPELFVRFERYQALHPDSTISVKELASLFTEDASEACQSFFDNAVINNTVAMGVTSLVFNFASCIAVGLVNIRSVTMVALVLGGGSAGSIYWMTSSVQNLIVSCIFQATMITANMTIAGIGVELFPTTVNGIAVCLILFSGRIGAVLSNILFGYLVDSYCGVAVLVVSVVVFLGGLLCLFIPSDNNNRGLASESSNVGVSVISDRQFR
ncbi:unnamed protein product [Callosobruchus maculatus]|uniref:Major facilitator superfamily (MFS) profile domain-containing protein n=1 Tax=Callosobruchus maculatus TaxID=64391 RepID=A0A653BRL7_CALMS|nr:unnamed protein product [Callosobruchus maculatus]